MPVNLPALNINDGAFKVPVQTSSLLLKPVQRLQVGDYTSGQVNGTGVFDKIMSGISAHLKAEFDRDRITGAEYTKAYITLTQSAMATALQFMMNAETTFWASQGSQIDAISGLIRLESDRVAYATAQYNFEVLLPLQRDQAQIQLDTATYNLQHTLPAQLTLTQKQTDLAEKQTDLVEKQAETQDFQTDLVKWNSQIAEYNLTATLPAQLTLTEKQTDLVEKQTLATTEQAEAQRAQTLDTRSDGTTPVAGVLGKQKSLLTRQEMAYQRDSEVKAAKLFVDPWITMKTMDEGLTPPTGFTNSSLDDILTALKANNGF